MRLRVWVRLRVRLRLWVRLRLRLWVRLRLRLSCGCRRLRRLGRLMQTRFSTVARVQKLSIHPSG